MTDHLDGQSLPITNASLSYCLCSEVERGGDILEMLASCKGHASQQKMHCTLFAGCALSTPHVAIHLQQSKHQLPLLTVKELTFCGRMAYRYVQER